MVNRIRLLVSACIGELLTRFLRIEILEFGPGYATMKMPVRDWFVVSPNRVVQGGITAVLADWAGVHAAMSSIEDGHTYLVRLKISYKKTIKSGEAMISKAKVTRTRGRFLFVSANVFNETSELKAICKLVFKAPKTP